MNSKSFAFLARLALLSTAFPVLADVSLPNGDVPASMTSNATVAVNGNLTLTEGIDLKGCTLTLIGVTGMAGTYSITDSVGGGVLDMEVTKDVTQSGAFGGELKFIKRGAGQFNVVMNQTYAGGTEIYGGSLYPKDSSPTAFSNSGYNPYGDRKSTIRIYSEGLLNVRAPTKWDDNYPIELYGGAISNIQTRSGGSFAANKVKLYAASAYFNNNNYGLAAEFDLNGHTLTIQDEFNGTMSISPKFNNAGMVVVKGSKTMTLVADISMPVASLKAETAVNLNNYVWTVLDYESVRTAAASYSGKLKVNGVFRPTTDYFFAPIMQNGSTIDLSAKKGTWAGGGTDFADDATINIDIGSRTDLVDGSMLVSWSETEYNGRTFALLRSGVVAEDFELQAQGGGLMIMSKGAKIPTAVWEGTKSADALDPDNWTWRDAPVDHPSLPDETYAVEIAWGKLPNLNWPETDALSYASLTFTGGKPAEMVVMAGSRDWRGLGGMDVPFSIDLAGKTLEMTFKDGTSAEECEVTSSAAGGVLIAKVEEEKEFDNTLVTLSGALTLVKDGAGTFVATKYPQEYEGSTIVSNGVLKCADNADLTPSKSTKSPFGAQRIVNIMPNGSLDPAGSYHWNYQTINAFGGTISNTVARNGLSGITATAKSENQFNPTINLFSNLVFATMATFNFQGVLNPTETANGLEIRVYKGQDFVWYPTWATNLVINVSVGGCLKMVGKTPVAQSKMRGSTLRMSGAALDVGQCGGYPGGLEVDNYIAEYAYEYNVGDATMSVFGVFTPNAVDGKGKEYFRGCTMMDGSTINLCGERGLWSTRSAMQGKNTMTFAKNATVTIDVHGRTFKGRTQIVEWVSGSTNGLDTVRFMLDAETKKAGYSLFYERYVDDGDRGGLYVGRKGCVLRIM